MRGQSIRGMDSELTMQQARVAEINLQCANLPFFQVRVPCRKLAHHEQIGQQIKVAPDTRLAHRQRARQLCGVPNLAVVMREQRPKSRERGRGDVENLPHVALKKRPRKITAPNEAGVGRIWVRNHVKKSFPRTS